MIQKTYFKTKEYSKVKFSIAVENAETVEIFGLNNDWDTPVEMKKKKDGSFSCELNLPKNTSQEFKYRINGAEWINDPAADNESPNAFGGTNSVIAV